MPGYVIHLAMGSLLLDKYKFEGEDRDLFLLGCVAPDVVKDNKKHTHFWDDKMYTYFARKPIIENFQKKYYSHRSNPFVKGYYSHLLLDKKFIEEYWSRHFHFFDEEMKQTYLYNDVKWVCLVDDGKIYSREEFFSMDMYYGDYDRMNNYFTGKYNIQKPSTDILIPQFFEEITSDMSDAVGKMLSLLTEKSDTPAKPELKVFKLEELEELIEAAAGEIAHEKITE